MLNILLLSLTSFSQKDTTNVTCLPTHVAQKIAIDLVRCDSVAAELEITQELLGLTEAKVFVQDSINNILQLQHEIYEQQIDAYQEQVKLQDKHITELRTSNATLTETNRRQHNRLMTMTGVSITLLLVILGIS